MLHTENLTIEDDFKYLTWSLGEFRPLVDTRGRPELTACVDDAEVFPGARVTRITKFSGGGTNQAAFLPLTAGRENLQGHR